MSHRRRRRGVGTTPTWRHTMMPGEDQERLEDYLELEHFLEELQAGRGGHPPGGGSPEKAPNHPTADLIAPPAPDEARPRAALAAEMDGQRGRTLHGPARTRP